ncbi:DUF7146 domain-containing protein, partial [Candidatus Magnetaquicoccus inordinatus]|uniref:DUF7146 domain-containing protein n=1 Tax=Candidatus Magnetaquicoccus inordinatus TaxID=2496818 RepID=UPI001D0EDD33
MSHSGCDSPNDGQPSQPSSPNTQNLSEDQKQKKAYAIRIWNESIPDPGPVTTYLAGRAIVMPVDSANIRYNPTKNAMVALVRNGAGDPIAIHRTFFGENVPSDERKKMLGSTKGGTVRLSDHLVGGNKMAIGEGIESCLSFLQATGIITWSGLTEGGMRGFELPAEKPSTAYILADVDEPKTIRGQLHRVGQEAARKAATRLANMGIETYIVWPGDPEGQKVDFNDLLQADPTGESIRAALANAERVEQAQSDPTETDRPTDKPVITVVGGNLHEIVVRTELALIQAEKDECFQRGGMLVRVAKLPKTEVRRNEIRREEGALAILPVDQAWIELTLVKHMHFEKWDARRGKMVRIDCPPTVSRSILARSGDWPFPSLAGIIEAPTIRPDGSILEKTGYDHRTGLYLDTSGVEYSSIPDQPSHDDAINALKLLETVIA